MGPFRIVALWCWYRGAGFRGYQQQQGHRTVQGECCTRSLAGLSRNPVVAGRTDRGVGARMQVLSARLERERNAETLVPALNALLPRVHLVAAKPAPAFMRPGAAPPRIRYTLDLASAGDSGAAARRSGAGARDPRLQGLSLQDQSPAAPSTVRSVEVLETPAGRDAALRRRGLRAHDTVVPMLVGGMTAVSRRHRVRAVPVWPLEQRSETSPARRHPPSRSRCGTWATREGSPVHPV